MPKNKFLSALVGIGLSIAVGAICFLICFLMQNNPAIKEAGNQVGIFTASLGLALVLSLLFLSVYFDWPIAFRIIALALGGLLSLFGALSVTRGAFLAPQAENIYAVAMMNILPGFVVLVEYGFLRKGEEEPFDHNIFTVLSFPISLAAGFIFATVFAIFRENAFVGGWLTLILYVAFVLLIHFFLPKIKLPKFKAAHHQSKPKAPKEKKQKEPSKKASNDKPGSGVSTNKMLVDCEEDLRRRLLDFFPVSIEPIKRVTLDAEKPEDRYEENGQQRAKNLKILVKFNIKDFYYKIYAEKHLSGDDLKEYNHMGSIVKKASQNLSDLEDWQGNGGDAAMQVERDANAEYNSEHYFREKSNDLNNAYNDARKSNLNAAKTAGANQDDIALACFVNGLLDHVQNIVMKYIAQYGSLYYIADERIYIDGLEFVSDHYKL